MTTIRRCLLTGAVITTANDSRAHVIPSALGGRLKPKGILCREANGQLGRTVDKLLVDALSPLMTLVDGKRDQGSNQPVTMTESDGTTYAVAFNEPIRPRRPSIEEREEGNSTIFELHARTKKEMKQLLGRVKSRHPEFDVDEALNRSETVSSWPSGGQLQMNLELGSRRTFPGIFAAANIFAAQKGLEIHPAFVEYIETFDMDEAPSPPDTFYFYQQPDELPGPEEVTHRLHAIADPERKSTLVTVRLFDAIETAVKLPYSGETMQSHHHDVDILSGNAVEPISDHDDVLRREWKATHELGGDMHGIIEARVGRLIGIYQEREAKAWVGDKLAVASEKLAGPMNARTFLSVLTDAHRTAMSEATRPGRSTASKEEIKAGFEGLVFEMAKVLAGEEAELFVSQAGALCRQLADACSEGRS